jgi:hypothetical protein
MLDHRLRSIAKMLKVSEAYPVNAGCPPPCPPAPDQSRNVQQQWSIVHGHAISE